MKVMKTINDEKDDVKSKKASHQKRQQCLIFYVTAHHLHCPCTIFVHIRFFYHLVFIDALTYIALFLFAEGDHSFWLCCITFPDPKTKIIAEATVIQSGSGNLIIFHCLIFVRNN